MSLAVIAAIRAERLETTVTDTGPGRASSESTSIMSSSRCSAP
jgi:hypothetical protein